MRIEYREFSISPTENAIGRFDLIQTVPKTRAKKDNPTEQETYESKIEHGFGMSLEYCISKIVESETIKSFGDEVVTLRQYVDRFKEQKEEIKKLIDVSTNIKIK